MTQAKEPARPRTRRRIPEFVSRQEEAQRWDTQDITEHLDELKTVRVHFARNLSEGITIRLDPETLDQLRKQAHEQGIGPTTLVRMWILKRLRRSQPLPASG